MRQLNGLSNGKLDLLLNAPFPYNGPDRLRVLRMCSVHCPKNLWGDFALTFSERANNAHIIMRAISLV